MLLSLRISPPLAPRPDEKPSLEPADQPEPDEDEKTPPPTGRMTLILNPRRVNAAKPKSA